MKDLMILGTGVHAGEMAEIVERVNRVKPAWRLIGLIAAEEKDAGAERNGVKAIGWRPAIEEHDDAWFVPDNEWPKSIEVPRERLVSLIDPSAFLSRTARIGAGCVLYPNCFVGLNATLGDYVFCLAGCTINHDDIVEERVVMATGVTLAGSVHVEADCYLGQSSTVRQYTKIGRNSLLGMGAVVVKDVPAGSIMVGNPARKLRDR